MGEKTNGSEKKSKHEKFLQQKLNKEKPKFILCEKGFTHKNPDDNDGRVQCFLSLQQIQQLILSSFLPGPKLSFKPNWYILERCMKACQVAIFVLDFDKIDHAKIESFFKEIVRFESEDNWVQNILSIAISKNRYKKIDEELLKKIEVPEEKINGHVTKMGLLLSADQMLEEGFLFPQPLSSIKHTIRKRYLPVTEDSPLLAMDCEMCLTIQNKQEVTRVSLVNQNYEKILDTLVKPANPIKDYLTKYSGITKEMLDPVTVNLSDVRKMLRRAIPRNAIICGQSLNNDFKALETFHPYVIDTSVIYNHSGSRFHKTGLKNLSLQHLGESIQASKKGHDSIEDATATMKLVNLKLEKGLSYADRILGYNIDRQTPFVTIQDYLKMNEAEIKVFYDFLPEDPPPRFISVSSSFSPSILTSLFKVINLNKKICVLLTKDGFCYVNV